MESISRKSKYIAFLDECGDHSLNASDKGFPIFLLVMLVVERKNYVEVMIPKVNKLKLDYWSHEGVNLHNRDIRKANGPFSFLNDSGLRDKFLYDLSKIMKECKYKLFISAIDKQKHKNKYGPNAYNPYNLALKFNLERVWNFLSLENENELPIIAESRGVKEDNALEIEFLRLLQYGSEYISGLTSLKSKLSFKNKRHNIIGMQLADLCAHPCARHILKPNQKNQAFDIVLEHVYKNRDIKGWKVFPEN
ncbi:DUF3800 domain-containing protein [Lentisphaerota bacterium ZTH]|nr:DUF3800 domain-containing protein [Lentisphaerota bacterium]WET06996.1 DUF3800 domain-containing protein [Lentisphaerota bacterium ZTH]